MPTQPEFNFGFPAPYIQTEEEILAAGPDRYAAINRLMGDLLGYLRQNRE